MIDTPKVIWLSRPATSEEFGVRVSDPLARRRHFPVYQYIRADSPELVALVQAVKYVLDGYGLNAPDYKDIHGEHDESDLIVEALRPALAKWEALQ